MKNIYRYSFNGTISYTLKSWLKDYFRFNSARPIISLTITLFLAAICRDARAQFTFDTSIKVDGVGFPEDLAIGDFDNNGYKDIAYVTSTDGKYKFISL